MVFGGGILGGAQDMGKSLLKQYDRIV